MKRPVIFLFLALTGQSAVLAGTATVTTQPVGMMTVEAVGGSSSALSLPLDASPAYVGEVSVVGKRTITCEGSGWTPRTIASYRRNPFAVRLTDGRSKGQTFLIVSGGGKRLRLDTTENLNGKISIGDHFEILPADTLESMFGADGGGMLTDPNPDLADNVRLLQDGKWETYYHDGSQWRLKGDATLVPRNSTPVAPGEGFLVVRRSPGDFSLQVTGDVPEDATAVAPKGVSRALLGVPFSTDHRLADLGLQKRKGWQSVSVWGAGGWQRYFFRNGSWINEQGRSSRGGPRLVAGSAVLIERGGGGEE